MGLDQYLYRVRRLSSEEVKRLRGKHVPEMPKDILKFYATRVEDEDNHDLLKELLPYLTKFQCVTTVYDLDRLKAENNLQDSAYVVNRYISNSNITMVFVDGHRHKSVTFRADDYRIDRTVWVYACHCEEVKYWRRDSALRERVRSVYKKDILNCGYYHLDRQMLDELGMADVEGNIFYHEWE